MQQFDFEKQAIDVSLKIQQAAEVIAALQTSN